MRQINWNVIQSTVKIQNRFVFKIWKKKNLTLRLPLSDGIPYFTNTSKIQLKILTIYFLFVENWITFNIKESFMRKPFPWLYI